MWYIINKCTKLGIFLAQGGILIFVFRLWILLGLLLPFFFLTVYIQILLLMYITH